MARRTLNDVDKFYIDGHKDKVSAEELAKTLNVNINSVQDYIGVVQPKKKKPHNPHPGVVVMDQAKSEQGDKAAELHPSSTKWPDRIYRPYVE